MSTDISILNSFLRVSTPKPWLQYALANIPMLLVDHAHCERKAAATALNFISKYPEKEDIVAMMSPLAREELLHFEKVMDIINERDISFGSLSPSSYAQRLHKAVTVHSGNDRLRDQLIVGAIIEARSCERFFTLAAHIDDPTLSKFYAALVKAEARHFEDYLQLAKKYGDYSIDGRIQRFLDIENELIASEDEVFRFHSGIPKVAVPT